MIRPYPISMSWYLPKAKVVTMSGLMNGRSVMSPVSILASVFVIPMIEMRREALTEVTPISSAKFLMNM